MARWNEGVFDSDLSAELVLRQAEIGVIVADRQGNVLFANEHVAALLRLPSDASKIAGQPLHALGFIPDGDLPKAAQLSRQVLSGMTWDGTFTGSRGDGSLVFLRVLAVPLRHSSGDIGGMVIMVTEAGRRDAQREHDWVRLLERIGERLAGSLELDTTLRHVAQILVPQFADHCFIDLVSGDKLVRRVMTHAGGWEPAAGTWAGVGEPISYPAGHFMQPARRRLQFRLSPRQWVQTQSLLASPRVGRTRAATSRAFL